MLAIALLLGSLFGMGLALILVILGIVRGVSRKRRSPGVRWKAAALIAGAGAVGMYAWGMAYLGSAVLEAEDGGTDSSPARPCREGGEARAADVIDYRVGFVPLRFECRLTGSGSYATSSVPAYVNPVAGGLGLISVTCGGLFVAIARRSSRTRFAQRGL